MLIYQRVTLSTNLQVGDFPLPCLLTRRYIGRIPIVWGDIQHVVTKQGEISTKPGIWMDMVA